MCAMVALRILQRTQRVDVAPDRLPEKVHFMRFKNSYAAAVAAAVSAVVFSAAFQPASARAATISEPNLVSGLAANLANTGYSSFFATTSATTVYGPNSAAYGPLNATNGSGGGAGLDFVFAGNDSNQRLALTGFNDQVGLVRIWSSDLRPLQVTIRSSTSSTNSITAGSYETLLTPTTSLAGSWITTGTAPDGLVYRDFIYNSPVAGTRSIYFGFGAGNDTTGSTGFARISEVQVFAVPEPGSLALFGIGALGVLGLLRRRGALTRSRSPQHSGPQGSLAVDRVPHR